MHTCKRELAHGHRQHAFDGKRTGLMSATGMKARTGAPVATKHVSQHPAAILPYINILYGVLSQARVQAWPAALWRLDMVQAT